MSQVEACGFFLVGMIVVHVNGYRVRWASAVRQVRLVRLRRAEEEKKVHGDDRRQSVSRPL